MSTVPLAALGPVEPVWITRDLRRFGRNPHGHNVYRLVWSPNKLMHLDNEVMPPRWGLEKWLSPEQFAGSEIVYNMGPQRQGPYPREGYWCESFAMPPGVPLSAEVITALCTLIERGRANTFGERVAALKEREAKKEAERKRRFDEAAKEVQCSASEGRTQQAVTGPINKFRTTDDWERDNSGPVTTKDLPFMPDRGLMQY